MYGKITNQSTALKTSYSVYSLNTSLHLIDVAKKEIFENLLNYYLLLRGQRRLT